MVEILLNSTDMKTISLKVSDRITDEIDRIQNDEGLGNRTSTITFLVKYYFLTKKRSFEESVDRLEKALSLVDWNNLPSLDEQLKDI